MISKRFCVLGCDFANGLTYNANVHPLARFWRRLLDFLNEEKSDGSRKGG